MDLVLARILVAVALRCLRPLAAKPKSVGQDHLLVAQVLLATSVVAGQKTLRTSVPVNKQTIIDVPDDGGGDTWLSFDRTDKGRHSDMDTRQTQRRRLNMVVALVAAFLLGGATYSAVQVAGASGTSATYYGCLQAGTGTLSKVGVKPPTCPAPYPKYKVISWNSVGPQGPPGAAGDTGATGPQGLQGPAGPGQVSLVTSLPSGSSVQTLDLPQGDFTITGHFSNYWQDYNENPAACFIYNSNLTNVTAWYYDGSQSNAYVQAAVAGALWAFATVGAGGGSVSLSCSANAGDVLIVTATPTT